MGVRSRRANAGNRLQSLLAEQIPLDDADAEYFAEKDDDEDFDLEAEKRRMREERMRLEDEGSNNESENDSESGSNADDDGDENEDDEADSLDDENFSETDDSELEADDEPVDAGEKQLQVEQRQHAREKRIAERNKMFKIKKRPPPVPVNENGEVVPKAPKKPKPMITPEQLVSRSRHNERQSAMRNKQHLIEQIREAEERRAQYVPPKRKKVRRMTQEERLEEAKKTEMRNMSSLSKFVELEEERRIQQRLAMLSRRPKLTHVIRYHSSSVYEQPYISEVSENDEDEEQEQYPFSGPLQPGLPLFPQPYGPYQSQFQPQLPSSFQPQFQQFQPQFQPQFQQPFIQYQQQYQSPGMPPFGSQFGQLAPPQLQSQSSSQVQQVESQPSVKNEIQEKSEKSVEPDDSVESDNSAKPDNSTAENERVSTMSKDTEMPKVLDNTEKTGKSNEDSKPEDSKHEDSKHEDSKHEDSKPEDSEKSVDSRTPNKSGNEPHLEIEEAKEDRQEKQQDEEAKLDTSDSQSRNPDPEQIKQEPTQASDDHQPIEGPPRLTTYNRLTFHNFENVQLNKYSTRGFVLGPIAATHRPIPPKRMCPFTGTVSKYIDPSTDLAYTDLKTNELIKLAKQDKLGWSKELGGVLTTNGQPPRHAKGVPKGFA